MSSKLTFLRQGSWMIGATAAAGVFMFATNVVAQRMTDAEFTVFRTMLTIYSLMSFPATGLQVVFTQQAASAATEEDRHRLAGAVRAVLGGTFVLWLGMAVIVFVLQGRLLESFKIVNPAALWITVLLGISSLWLPVFRGLLQGAQHFFGLGTVAIVDGFARCSAVAVIVALGGQAAGGMTGALIGQVAALTVVLWVTRDLWRGVKAPFAWGPWFRRVIPLTSAFSSVLLMMGADAIFVPYLFAPEQAKYYMHAQIIGVALLSFTTPLAAVMFPKVVASAQRAHRSDALLLGLGTTAALLGTAAVACTLFPELPLRILFFSKPEIWKASALVPWFAWALLPLILANVLVNNLMARERFVTAPWLAGVAVCYGCALYFLRERLLTMETFTAFKTILGTLGVFSLLMLCVAVVFTRNESNVSQSEAR